MGIKAQVGELVEALRWSQATIDWAERRSHEGRSSHRFAACMGNSSCAGRLDGGSDVGGGARTSTMPSLTAESADAMTLAIVHVMDRVSE